ncbi:hypothetical protein [Bhargavaea cecembensis]|uniref:hypothetical protein n=1 Tax=Bhargavaea cecembensis TaxID=394098 RepID=UPI001178A3CB|nr:hypothetical protein [Bhargavaea cecembensis]
MIFMLKDEEILYRAIGPAPFHWSTQANRPSSAAFYDKNGLSVDRKGNRDQEEIVELFSKRFKLKAVVSISAHTCMGIEVHPAAAPSRSNRWHAELHDSPDEKLIQKSKRLQLARLCRLVYIK